MIECLAGPLGHFDGPDGINDEFDTAAYLKTLEAAQPIGKVIKVLSLRPAVGLGWVGLLVRLGYYYTVLYST